MSQKLKDLFVQNWTAQINATSNSNLYKVFKTVFEESRYITILPTRFCKWFIRSPTRNHRLPVVIGRWYSVPLNECLCPLAIQISAMNFMFC